MKERLNTTGFHLMHSIMKLMDKIHPHVEAKANSFGIQRGMTVVDYEMNMRSIASSTLEVSCLYFSLSNPQRCLSKRKHRIRQ